MSPVLMSHSRFSLDRWWPGPRLSGRALTAVAAVAASSTALPSAWVGSAAAAPTESAPRTPQRATQLADGDEKDAGAVATFIGFRQLGSGRTLIYVELSEPVEATLSSKGKTLEYTLAQTRVTLRNNRRPLLARHFDSVVHSAQLVPQGKDVKLVIHLRQEATPQSRTVRHARGATFEVELARPDAPQK